jgi:hypothetical protein
MMRDFHSDIGVNYCSLLGATVPDPVPDAQRPFVILDPHQITGIKPFAALVTTQIVSGLGQWPSGNLPTAAMAGGGGAQ